MVPGFLHSGDTKHLVHIKIHFTIGLTIARKTERITIRLDQKLSQLLTKVSRSSGKSKSAIIREALARQLRSDQFDEIRRQILPFAEAQGLLTDEEVFSQVS